MTKKILGLWMVLALVFALGACGSDDDGGDGENNGANNGATNNGDANNGDTNNGDTNNGDTNNGDANNGDTNNGEVITGPIDSCSEANVTDCFSNEDCPDGTRCEDVGPDGTNVPCCVPGERGTGQTGDVCDTENDCESALCLEGFCTGGCDGDADCPETLPCCYLGACFPESESTCSE